MKNRTALSIFFIAFVLISELNAQSSNALEITLTLERDTFRFLDPWCFKVQLKNISDVDIEVMPTYIHYGLTSESAEIKLEIRNSNNKSWTDTKIISNWCRADNFKIYKLKANERILYEFQCPPPLEELEIGRNEIRVSFDNFCQYGKISYSAPKSIQIIQYANHDLAAFNYLKSLPNPAFILFPVVNISTDTSNIAHAKYLIEHFPKSYLAEYGKLNLSYMYLAKANIGAIQKNNTDRFLSDLRNCKKYGVSVLTAQDARIRGKANFLLPQLYQTAFIAYNMNLPDEIDEEFTFPFKY